MKKLSWCGLLLSLGITSYAHNIQQTGNGASIQDVKAFQEAVTSYMGENDITIENYQTTDLVKITGFINKVFTLAQKDANQISNQGLGDDDSVRICNSTYKALKSDMADYGHSSTGPTVEQCTGIGDEKECLQMANSQGRIFLVIKAVTAGLSVVDSLSGNSQGTQWCVNNPGTYRVTFEAINVLVTGYCRYFSEKGSFDNGNVQFDNTHICSPR